MPFSAFPACLPAQANLQLFLPSWVTGGQQVTAKLRLDSAAGTVSWFSRALRGRRQLTVSRTGLEVVTFPIVCNWQRLTSRVLGSSTLALCGYEALGNA
ncbi:hypothetical protein NUW54_g8150 [Trametes sanguinea]|uniref:Uncharacterized protein n=1 Tax=Trametes sanguinea TaxID=158606 RepID=A0ACC1PFE4_9APHY|nr:hypothetical protein NUW54_g8150 [Trametes sanguinea]